LEEKLQASKQALNTASSENIIEQCKRQEVVLLKLLNTGARAGAFSIVTCVPTSVRGTLLFMRKIQVHYCSV
jgi:hypothetical protein